MGQVNSWIGFEENRIGNFASYVGGEGKHCLFAEKTHEDTEDFAGLRLQKDGGKDCGAQISA